MTQAVTVRRDGDAFQARMFWLRAARLLHPQSHVARVGFESGPKGFDDIWVEYHSHKGPPGLNGEPLIREHIQCKWHVSPGTYGYMNLIDPEFINANAISLLQRARNAQSSHGNKGIRFQLLSNWAVDWNDPLREMVNQRNASIRIERLFASKTDNSKSGSIRKAWREHLMLNDDELSSFIPTLSLAQSSDSLDALRDRVNDYLGTVGLLQIAPHESSFIYDDLVFQWMANGKISFDAKEFKEICKRENILGGKVHIPNSVGIRSFEHPIDKLHDRCESVLDLIPFFNERFILNKEDWKDNLYPKLKSFLIEAAQKNECLRLAIDTHASLSFVAGSILNIKSGKKIEVEQRTIGRKIWNAGDEDHDEKWTNWNFEITEFSKDIDEIAICVSLTHNIKNDVIDYLTKNNFNLGGILSASIDSGANSNSIQCGQHAFELAESLAAKINDVRKEYSTKCVHIFIAAPNTFTFFLGQRQPSMGTLILYEYDFEGLKSGSYTPSLKLPIN